MVAEAPSDASSHSTSPPLTQASTSSAQTDSSTHSPASIPDASASSLLFGEPSSSPTATPTVSTTTAIPVSPAPGSLLIQHNLPPAASSAHALPPGSIAPPFETSDLPEIPDEILAHSHKPHSNDDVEALEPQSSITDQHMAPASALDEYATTINTAALPSMLNSTAIPLEQDASGDLSTSSNEALTLTSTVSRGNYHQCGSARRVKVYELKGETWFDRGTGYCAGVYDETVDEALLVARREEKCQFLEGIDIASEESSPAGTEPNVLDDESAALDGEQKSEQGEANGNGNGQSQPCQFVVVVSENLESEDILLASKVVKEEVYQRQQDTLVVWTEPTGVDMALSFQEAEGCNEVWEFLTEVQKHFMGIAEEALTDSPPTTPNPHSPSGALGMSASGMGMESLLDNMGGFVGLPDPTLASLEKIDMMLKDATSRGPLMREKLTAWLMESHYIRKLVPFFYTLEELEALSALHMLCIIMQTILLLNDSFVFEFILQDDVFLGVVGMLEYDPEFPRLKANYRQHLTQKAKFKQVVEIGDPMIVAKIHQTYRLLYLKDVVLARVVDDPTVSILNSFIFFHQNDIVNYCCQNEIFLGQLFDLFADATDADRSAESDERRSEAVLFLHQLCSMGKHIQLPARISLYRTLTECGLLNVLQYALAKLGPKPRNAAAEILMTIIEYDANSVRIHFVSQVGRNVPALVSLMIDMLHKEQDPGLKTQIAEAMRIIFDVSSDGGPMATQAQVLSVQGLNKIKADPDRFLTLIYEIEISRLFVPFNALPDFRVLSKGEKLPILPRHRSALYGHLCDLLCSMIAHHSFRSQYFVLTSEISKKVGSLLHSREKHLRLSALRFFKYCLASNNQFTNRHFIKIELFSTILYLTEAEGDRNNLVSSACLDFFEHIRRENLKTIISHCMEKYGNRMRALAQNAQVGNCFQALITQWERNQEPMPQDTTGDVSSVSSAIGGASASYTTTGAAAASSSAASSTKQEAQREAEQARKQRDLARRGADSNAMDQEEEDYFNDQEEDEDSGATSGSPNRSSTVRLRSASGTSAAKSGRIVKGLVPYADDDAEDDSGIATAKSGGPKSRLPEKRRREEVEDMEEGGDIDDDDDHLTRMAKRKSSRTSTTPTKSKARSKSRTVTASPSGKQVSTASPTATSSSSPPPEAEGGEEIEEGEGGEESGQVAPGGFIRSVANSISNTFGVGGRGGGANGSKTGKRDASKTPLSSSPGGRSSKHRSPSKKEDSEAKQKGDSGESSPAKSSTGTGTGGGVKKISLGLSQSSKKMAAAATANAPATSPSSKSKKSDELDESADD